TGIFQPADIGLNCVIKHQIKQHQTEYLVATHQEQINSGLTTEQVKFTTSLLVLQNTSVDGIIRVYEFITGPFGCELVQKVSDLSYFVLYSNTWLQSWESCRVKDWNLSATCLTSKAAQTALDEYLCTHPGLHDEIKEQMGVVYGVKDLSQQDQVTDDADDDADVLSSAVIQDAFGLLNVEIPAEVDAIPHCHDNRKRSR
ncbi:hypothetical protein BS17DRAFT_722119, partial [Gyrodon lividus]